MTTILTNALGTLTLDPATGVATLTMAMDGGVNKVNADFGLGLHAALEAVAADKAIKGLIVASAHRDFCVGADLDMLFGLTGPAEVYAMVSQITGLYRRLETLGKPVVAALTGSALGGGYELALACHHRIALDDAKVQLGLPEVMLGVIPGAGGTQRLPRLIGIQAAVELMAQGARLRAPKAKARGLVDALGATPDDVLAQAAAWDSRGFTFPGGVQPQTTDAMNLYTAAAAMLYDKTAGALRAPEVLLQVVQEGCRIDLERALEREARAFAAIATSGQAKDMMRTLWYHKNAADKHEGLPRAEAEGIEKVAILGAGMMGAGLAYLCAQAGYAVVVRDIAQPALDAARARVDENLKGLKHLSADERAAIADRVTYTLDVADLAGVQLVIEAVVENLAVKHQVIAEVEPLLADGAIFASNTSALPISDLA